jgi:hypothetical protein
MLHIRCPTTGWTGVYTNWYSKHRHDCAACAPELAKKTEREHESKAQLKHKHLLDSSAGSFPVCTDAYDLKWGG